MSRRLIFRSFIFKIKLLFHFFFLIIILNISIDLSSTLKSKRWIKMQLAMSLELNIILLPVCFGTILLGFFFYLRRDYKSIEFRVSSLIILLVMVFVMITIISAHFDFNILLASVLLPLGIGFTIFGIYTRNIRFVVRNYGHIPYYFIAFIFVIFGYFC